MGFQSGVGVANFFGEILLYCLQGACQKRASHLGWWSTPSPLEIVQLGPWSGLE